MTDTPEHSPLQPCPFCGGENLRWGKGKYAIRFECFTCRASGPPALEAPKGGSGSESTVLRRDLAENLWNARVNEAPELHKRIAELESLVRCLLENDPDEYAADGGVRVIDLWLNDAQRILKRGQS